MLSSRAFDAGAAELRIAANDGQVHGERGHHLSRAVVKLPRDMPSLLVLQLHEAARKHLELHGAGLDPRFELVPPLLQGELALLNLRQHLVERFDQDRDLVVARRRDGAYGVVLLAGDGRRDFREVLDGIGHGSPEKPGHRERGSETDQKDHRGDAEIAQKPRVERLGRSADVDVADRLVFEKDRPQEREFTAIEPEQFLRIR